MKDYIEVDCRAYIQGVTERELVRKDKIVGVHEEKASKEWNASIAVDAGEKIQSFEVLTRYDEIKAALVSHADTEEVNKIIDDLVNEVVVGPEDIGVDGYYFKVGNGFVAIDFLRRFAKQLKERLDSGLNNED